MFGPDICGTETRVTHAILCKDAPSKWARVTGSAAEPDDRCVPLREPLACETDQLTHMYTLHLKADATYALLVDGELRRNGTLEEGWELLPPRQVADAAAAKPADWVDDEFHDDPDDAKPADWDAEPRWIRDPEATKPEDWSDEDDGDWLARAIANPAYRGAWAPRRVVNPAYRGAWAAPLVANPEFVDDPSIARRCDGCAGLALELWQVKAGTIFDDLIVTDDAAEADAFARATFFAKRETEKAMFDAVEDEKKAKLRERRERNRLEKEERRKQNQGAAAPHTAEADDLDRRRAEHPLVASVDAPSTDSAPTADEPPEGADAREGEL